MAEFNFQISPKDAVTDIVANWESVLSMKAVETVTRAVIFIDMPVLSCEADVSTGVLTLTSSGENLSNLFYYGERGCSASLYISDGNNVVTSDFVPLFADVPQCRELRYTAPSYLSLNTAAGMFNGGELSIVSHTFEDGIGVITFDGVLRELAHQLPYNATNSTVYSITIPPTVTDMYSFTVTVDEVHVYDLARWLALDFKVDASATSYSTAPKTINPLSGASLYVNGVVVKDVVIPESITEIGNAVMMDADIDSVTIPDTVTSLGSYSFFNNNKSISIYIQSTVPPSLGAYAFASYSTYYGQYRNLSTIYVPEDALDTYKTAWSDYADMIYAY